MAWGNIELATIARLQDYTSIKQNEDNKNVAMQSNLVSNMHQQEEQKANQVTEAVKAEWLNKKFHGKEKGNGEYSGQGEKKKREKEPDRVIKKENAKSHSGFDIRI